MHDDKEKGLDVVMQELLGRLCRRHSTELRGLYFHPLGRRDEQGEAVAYDDDTRETIETVRIYLQDLESLLRHLDTDRTNVMLSNDELRVQLREKDKAFEEQEESIKEMETRLGKQDKRFKNQEKRVQDRNKKINEMKAEMELKDLELDTQQEVIKRLRSQKREL